MRSWPLVMVVVVICIGAGAAIAGLPGDEEPDLVVSADQVVTTLPPTTTATSVAVTTTTAAGAEPAGSTSSPSTPSAPSTEPVLGRAAVRVVIAGNAAALPQAAAAAEQLETAGYLTVTISTAVSGVSTTAAYYRAGLEAEAATVLEDLGLSELTMAPLPLVPVTARDSEADVVIVFAPTAP